MEIGGVKAKARTRRKGKGKEKPKREREREKFEGWCNNCGKWSHKLQLLAWKRETSAPSTSKAGTASSSSSHPTLSATDVGTKEIGLIESVCEDAEMSRIFTVADAVALKQRSMDGGHSLVVDSAAYVQVCPKSYAACWRGFGLRSASGKMLNVWRMSEIVYNAMDLHGKVITMKIPFVVCEVRRPLLSMAMLEARVSI